MASRSKRTLKPHPAPGALRLIQDFVNTRRLDTGRDELQGPQELRAWLARRDLLPADAELHEAAWGAAIAVRELLRTVIHSHVGVAPGADVAGRLNEAFGDGKLRMVFVAGNSMRLEPVGEGWPGILTRLQLILFEEMAAGRWRRLKPCHNPDCRRVFYDASRNRLGKWCHVKQCGDPVHSRAYRRRGRAGHRGRLTNSLIRG